MADRDELLLQVALLYYEEEVTQSKIAEMMKISRPTVATLLHEAKEKGIVKITIQHSEHNLLKKQEQLRQKYKLSTLKIASSGNTNQNSVKTIAGKMCADLVEPILSHSKKLGIGWGTTIYEYVNQAAYLDLKQLKIAPLIGGVGVSNVRYHSNHLAFILSQKYNCDTSYFYAPAIADSFELKEMLIHTSFLKEVMGEGKEVDVAVLGIGNPLHSSTYRKLGYINDEEIKDLSDQKTIGDIGGTFFNEAGEAVQTDISERMIGIGLEDIMKIPRVIIVATGEEKAASIKTLLELGFITDLIIDEDIADTLL
ncbi:sugar-binding transcriptional regulator [Enterococcus hulanensis]|uniref:sugar-binding transcriptional regulator n=1 Tax=Enterococcus hulanensis TaxID=2559929 RepID=UPI001A8D8D99|nr:sugar-binding transcriptional regulator [Enterococcus hulanensis]MBO0457729.1 sugar-binding transcriptional regulator [Enterococcus hulanensis]